MGHPYPVDRVAEAKIRVENTIGGEVDRAFRTNTPRDPEVENFRRVLQGGGVLKTKNEVLTKVGPAIKAATAVNQDITLQVKTATIKLYGLDLDPKDLDTFLDGLPEWCKEMDIGLEIVWNNGQQISTENKLFSPDPKYNFEAD